MKNAFALCLLLFSLNVSSQVTEKDFDHPCSLYAAKVYWQWMNGNVSREGLNLDLEAMAATGLGGGILLNSTAARAELTVHALQQSERLGLSWFLHIGRTGTWVDSDRAKQQVVWTEQEVKGGSWVSLQLAQPKDRRGYYRDIAVMAYPSQNQFKTPVQPSSILDLTALTSNGLLTWNAPKGVWTVVRFGYTPKASDSTEAEWNVLSSQSMLCCYENDLKPLLEWTKSYHGRSLEGIIMEPPSVALDEWTSDMLPEFSKRVGYDLKPYLLTYMGLSVLSTQETNRFRWDLQRIQSEMMEERFTEGMREVLRKNGLSFRIMTISSAWKGNGFLSHPASMKPEVDRFFAAGNDRFILNSYVHQPHSVAEPGMVLASGIPFDRNNTWFSKASDFNRYLARMQYVFQSTVSVPQVACFAGEDTAQSKFLDIPLAYDVLSRDALLQGSSVSKGFLRLSNGTLYRLLLLPSENRLMSLPVLRKLKTLLEDGLWLSASKPTIWQGVLSSGERSEWKNLVDEIWSKLPDGVYRFGAGRIFINRPNDLLFKEVHLVKEFHATSRCPNSLVQGVHRRSGNDHFWLVCNEKGQNDTLLASFRITGMQPEWWNPLSGTVHPLTIFRQNDGQTFIPLTLAPWESGFVVFRKPIEQNVFDGIQKGKTTLFSANSDDYEIPKSMDSAFFPVKTIDCLPENLLMNGHYLFRTKGVYRWMNPSKKTTKRPLLSIKKNLSVYQLNNDWTICFPEGKGAPAQLHLDSLTSLHTLKEEGVRSFSGTASWLRKFQLLPEDLMDNQFVLDLGKVAVLAEVYVNGTSAGICWTQPFRLDVTSLLKSGENTLDIRVTNLWVNRLIGDAFLPDENDYDASGQIQSMPEWFTNNLPMPGERVSFVSRKCFDRNAPLVESGLIGPVTLSAWKVLKE